MEFCLGVSRVSEPGMCASQVEGFTVLTPLNTSEDSGCLEGSDTCLIHGYVCAKAKNVKFGASSANPKTEL